MAKKSVSAMNDMEDWQAESDLRCLMDAEKIEKDPKRCKAAKDLAKKKLLEMAAVASEAD